MSKATLNIGRFNGPLASNRYAGFKSIYEKIDPATTLQEVIISDSNPSAISEIIDGNIDVLLLPLKSLSTKIKEEISIATLSVRERAAYKFFLDKKHGSIAAINQQKDLKIAVPNEAVLAQLNELFPQHNYTLNKAAFEALNLEGDIDGFIFSEDEIDHLQAAEKLVFDFSTSELIPLAGSGVYAGLCLKNNRALRKKLLLLNNRNTSQCTNVERSIMKEKFDSLSVFCQKNMLGIFELKACYTHKEKGFIRQQLSQNTYIGLADRMIELLRS